MSKIQWTDKSSNPIHLVKEDSSNGGHWCKKVSPGCANCYSETQNQSNYFGFASHLKYTGETPDLILDEKVLTKRPEKMHDIVSRIWWEDGQALLWGETITASPLPNVWLGTSIENQKALDSRFHSLRELRWKGWTTFYSVEPLLEKVNLDLQNYGVDWVIVGGESGKGARPCNYEWVLDIVEQCQKTGTPVFVKQLGSNYWQEGVRIKIAKKGGDFESLPSKLQIRQFPI